MNPRTGSVLGSAIIAALTLLYYRVVPVNATTVALSFLLVILVIASAAGLTAAIVTSVAGVVCLNYFFFPPIGTFTIADPQNWVALLAFLAAAAFTSHLSSSVKRRALEAERHEQEMEKLYALSRACMLQDADRGDGGVAQGAGRVAYQIAQVFGLRAVALYEHSSDRVFRAGPEDLAVSDSKLRDAALQGTEWHDPDGSVCIVPVSLGASPSGGGAPMASLAAAVISPESGEALSDAALHAIANLTAIVLERARTQDRAIHAEAARHHERLKTTLLNALAHELKTPLTSIKAAVSNVQESGEPLSRELLAIVEEETERLDALVTEALEVARIEAGDLHLDLQAHTPADLVLPAIHRLGPSRADRDIRFEVPPLPPVLADRELIGLVLRQLVGNSLKYARPDSPVTVRARNNGDTVTFSVIDQGPGIPERELPRIFEKYYRLSNHTKGVPGTGLGLTIAKEIVEAHRGKMSVKSRAGEGSEFSFVLPCAHTESKES